MHLAHDPFKHVLFASEERANADDFAHLDAHNLKTYAIRRLRAYIASNDDHNALDFTEAQIEVVGKAFEYSALRLPPMMRMELLNEYADRHVYANRPPVITREAIETLTTEWDRAGSKVVRTEPYRYKHGLDLSRVN
jgi:hypothetical protein